MSARQTVPERELRAASPTLTVDGQQELSADPSPHVRRVLAARPDLDPRFASVLASDTDKRVRLSLAENPAAPPSVLWSLVSDSDFNVRWSAVQNPGCGSDIHAAVLDGGDPDSAEAAAQLGDQLPSALVERILIHPLTSVKTQFAMQTRSEAALRRLAMDPVHKVREEVAANRACPPDVLTELATDRRASVRRAVATNPRAPREVQIRLSNDRSADVQLALILLRRVEPELAERLLSSRHKNVREQAYAALNPPAMGGFLSTEGDSDPEREATSRWP